MSTVIRYAITGFLLLIGVASLAGTAAIEKIIRESGIQEGNAPVREMSGWHEPHNNLIRNDANFVISDGVDFINKLQESIKGVDLIGVKSEADAMFHV